MRAAMAGGDWTPVLYTAPDSALVPKVWAASGQLALERRSQGQGDLTQRLNKGFASKRRRARSCSLAPTRRTSPPP